MGSSEKVPNKTAAFGNAQRHNQKKLREGRRPQIKNVKT